MQLKRHCLFPHLLLPFPSTCLMVLLEHGTFFQAFTEVLLKLWTRSHRLEVRHFSIWFGQVFSYVRNLPPLPLSQHTASEQFPAELWCRARPCWGIVRHPAIPSVASVSSCCCLLVAGELCSHLLQGPLGCCVVAWVKMGVPASSECPVGWGQAGISAGGGGERRAWEGEMCLSGGMSQSGPWNML